MSAVGSQIQPAAGPSKGLVSKVGSIFRKKQPNRALDATKAVIPLGKRWTTTEFRVEQGEADMRLDRLITSKYEISRPLLQKLLRKRLVQLERPDYVSNPGQLAEPHQIISIPVSCSARVQEGDVISLSEVFLKEKQGSLNTICYEDLTPKKLEKLREMVIFKDENILVLNKPAGLATHNGPGLKTDEHLEGLLEGLKFELEETPRLVHRLDKDTSGVLLLARTRKAAADLASRFQQSQLDRRVQKYYWAMVKGEPPVKQGRVVSNIYRAGEFPTERMTSLPDSRIDILDEGKVAITRFRQTGLYVKARPQREKLGMLELQPLTGRTHQIRVHLAEQLNTPIVGDLKYAGGRGKTILGPLHLHSRKLVLLDYPEKGQRSAFVAPIPNHFVSTMLRYPLFLKKKPTFPKKKLHNQK